MPPVGRGLCLTFESPSQLATFIQRSKRLHLPHPITKPIPLERRDLYAPQAVAGLDVFLAQLPFPLAFELNKSVLSGMLTPVNVYRDLKQAILTLLAEEPENAAPIFRSFVLSLRTPGIEAIKIPPVKNRRRRRRTPRRTAATLLEKLAHVTADYFSGPDQPTGRLSFRTNNTNTAVCLSYHLRITPSARLLEGPLPDQSNSVLRRFGNHECFLRVTFQEESGSKLRQEGGSTHELLRDRYRPYLVNGVKVAGRHYDFLGYSMSGLKEYTFTFSRPFVFEGKLMDASDIRNSLGDFSAIDKKPALLAARWSQAFSASAPSVTLNPDSIQSIPDRHALDGSCFTDGVGTISLNLAQDVQNALRYHRRRARHTNEPPSALQIRFGGAKGVLVVDPRLHGRVVCLRESQTKFKGTGRTLDIATTSARPILTYLNRPLIVLLEHHGVNGNYIKQLQDLMVEEVTSILRGFDSAAAILTQNGLGTSFGLPSLLRHLHSILGIQHHLDSQHPSGLGHQLIFTSLHYAETHILREIKHRAHIRVPGSYTLIGVADEWDCLSEGEIYATVVDEENEVHEEIAGKVLITRSPQIHPGDAQMVTAVRRPQLAHLRNVVVFPCRGGRSLPSMLGGGDLDGDIYNLIVDPNLHLPSGRTSEAGAYTPLDKKETTNPCSLEDVADFVIDFINSDLLGAISIRHLRISDIKGAGCEDCIKLAELASHAVDFPKTGTPVNFRDVPDVPSVAKPDFLSGDNPSGEFYKSKKILGELYRNVPDEKFHPDQSRKHITDGQTIIGAIRRLELDELGLPSTDTPPNEEILADVGDLLTEYSTHLLQIAKAHIASTKESDHISEAELVSGTIQARWSDPRKRREAVMAMNIQTQELSAGIRRELCYAQQPNGDEDEEDMYDLDDLGLESQREAFTRAYAAWMVAEEALEDDHGAFGPASFGLLALGILLELIKARMKARHA